MEFILSINPIKFRSTNAIWNNLMLNDPWSVGYVSMLIELERFTNKEEWETFYYNSGAERDAIISKSDIGIQNILQNELLVLKDKTYVNNLAYGVVNINKQFGRTKENLYNKAVILFEAVKNNGLDITVEECFECVRFRVICETWNGIIIRERNTIETLKKYYPYYEFRKVFAEIDHKYAVDYEIYKENRLAVAIQIKPKSYTWDAPYINKARDANQQKNKSYSNKFNVCVFDIISDSKGNIFNSDILKKL